MSNIEEADENSINRQIAAQVSALRAQRSLSLEALAAKSGVSRSMISLIERAEASPTAVLLERLSVGLGVPLARLFDVPVQGAVAPQRLTRRAQQPQWRDPGSGYLRRNVSPPHWPSPFQITEVEFPAGARVAYDSAFREPVVHQQVWVLSGQIELSLGDERFRLAGGDCLAMRLDRPMLFENRTRKRAHYVVVVSAESGLSR